MFIEKKDRGLKSGLQMIIQLAKMAGSANSVDGGFHYTIYITHIEDMY